MNKTTTGYNERDLLVKRKMQLENEVKELQRQFQESLDDKKKDIEAIDRVLPMLESKRQIAENNERRKTNYEIVEEILKTSGEACQIKELHSKFIQNGGKTERPSFDVFLGKWVKHPNKKIERVGMGLYKYTA